jgi:hypothetical protein
MRWLSILVLALALVAAGCGGSDNESATSDDETTVEETLTEETTDGATTDESTTDTDLSGILGDEDCLALASVGVTFAQALSGASTDEATEAFADLAEKVPDEIEGDVQILAQWFAQYSADLEAIGLEAGATPTAEQLQQLQALAAPDQEVTAASNRIEAWSQENCTG